MTDQSSALFILAVAIFVIAAIMFVVFIVCIVRASFFNPAEKSNSEKPKDLNI
jgi:hypothetical protein